MNKPERIRTVQPGDKITLHFNRSGEIWFLPKETEYEKNETKNNNTGSK